MSNNIFGFFGLREDPFRSNPDPRFTFLTPDLQSVSDELIYAIENRKGLILLTGEVGTGKTMLVRRLLNWLSEQKMPTALIFNARLNPDNLLDLILNDFGIPCNSSIKSEKLIHLNNWLLERYRAGQIPVLVVDEAQGMPRHVLEEVRLLMNFETPRDKLLQIVLAGQPELNDALKRHELRQLRQRIAIRCKTAPLTLEQTHGYITERLRIAGATAEIFDPQSLDFVHSYAHGIPRVINVLCEHALIDACADGSKLVSPHHVEQAARECQLENVGSVSRILHTGSYARTSLDEIALILASVSENSTQQPPAPTPLNRSVEQSPAGVFEQKPQCSRRRYSASETSKLEVASTPQTQSAVAQPPNESMMQADLGAARPTPENYDRVPPTRFIRNAPKSLPPWTVSVLHLLRGWGKSFSTDAQRTLRPLRKSLESARLRHWLPIRRELRLRSERMQMSLERFLANRRWGKLAREFARGFQAAYRRADSHLSAWLNKRSHGLPSHQLNHSSERRTESSNSLTHERRHRRIASLRRWLQQPMADRSRTPNRSPDEAPRRNTTQR